MRIAFPAFAAVLAIAGGIFLGLFSCGGYVWHEQLFSALFAVALIGSLLLPPNALKRWLRRVAFVVSTVCVFTVVRAVASAFYPAPPNSIGVFARAVLAGLWGPSC